ncbi:unnamed protein product [Dicrocoelium dendriticum]|nr:unnamed protein product [Dicrocoelium dendriticum]
MNCSNDRRNVLLSSWLYTRKYQTHATAEDSQFYWNHRHLAKALLTSTGQLELLHRGRMHRKLKGDNGQDDQACFRICGLQRLDSRSFILNLTDSGGKQKSNYELHCFHPYASVTKKWVDSIQQALGVKGPRGPPDIFETSFSLLVQLAGSKITDAFSSSQQFQLASGDSETAKMTIRPRAITFEFGANENKFVVLRMKMVTVFRNDETNSDLPHNTIVLQHKDGFYICVAKDSVQRSIACSLITLWSRCLQIPPRQSLKSNGRRCIQGHLWIGLNSVELERTWVRVCPGSRILECANFRGKPAVFDACHSTVLPTQLPQEYICRVTARSVGVNEASTGFIELYVRAPTYSAMVKWSRHFNLSHSTVLFIVDVVLTELQRRYYRQVFSSYETLSESDLTLEDALMLATCSYPELRRRVRRSTLWPSERLVRLLSIILESLPEPIISRECYQRISAQLWEKPPKLKEVNLPSKVTDLTALLSAFQLCVILRFALHFMWGIREGGRCRNKTDGENQLKPIMLQWQNCLTFLTGGSWLKGLSVKEQLQAAAVLSVFLSAYQYLLQSTMV